MKYPAAVAIVAATMLAGCSAPASPPPSAAPTAISTPTASPSEPTPTATEPAQSERGHTIKKVGEGAKLIDGNGELAVAFTVTKIQRNFKCNSGYSDKAKNGHYVAIWMKIQTTKAVDGDSSDSAVVPYFNPGDWEVIGPDGTTENDSEGNGYSCAKDSISLPSQLGPSKKVSGVVVLDTKFTKGHLALVQDFAETGWEWEF